jgi:hypothetical protein
MECDLNKLRAPCAIGIRASSMPHRAGASQDWNASFARLCGFKPDCDAHICLNEGFSLGFAFTKCARRRCTCLVSMSFTLPIFPDSLRIANDPTRTQRESNKIRRIGKMLPTITNPFGPSA